tara:strand:- start:123 stop:683 length:561 start_codon:yes stop_codon:yes gene_type:complete
MLLDIFPTKIKISKNFLNKKDIDKYLDKVNQMSLKKHAAIIGESLSSHKEFTNFLENTDLEKRLNESVAEYCVNCGYENSKIDMSWVNIQNEGSILKMHHHGSTPITGALFLKTDEKSSKLCFENPNPFSKIMMYSPLINNDLNVISFNVQEGDLFIFPGWLMHGSNYENNKSQKRIVLSFNCKYI